MAKVTPLRAMHHVAPVAQKTEKTQAKIKRTTNLQPLIGLDGAKAIAAIKRRRKRQKHLRRLERFIAENACPRKFFRPLEKYLIQKIREGQTRPGLTSLLVDYENVPAFSVTYF